MRFSHYRFALLVILSVFLLGCQGPKETDEVAFIFALGLDKDGQDKVKVTYRILIPRAASSQANGAQPPRSPVVSNSIIAPNTAEAFNLLGSTISRFPNLMHLKAIAISEELARSGISEPISALVRYREYRGTVYIVVVKGRADEFFEKNLPKLDYFPTKFWETFMQSAKNNSYYSQSDLHDFYLHLKSPGASPYAAYVGINALAGVDRPAAQATEQDRTNAYLPGGIPRTGDENQIEIAGTALFSGYKMVGTIDTKQTRTLAILQNTFEQGFFVLSDPLDPGKKINVNLRNGSKPAIKASLINGKAFYTIKVFLEGEISAIPSGISYEKTENRQLLEAAISSLIKEQVLELIRYTQKLGSDAAGLGRYLRPEFASYEELRQANLIELFRTADVQVEVTTELRRTGLMWRTSPYAPVKATDNGG